LGVPSEFLELPLLQMPDGVHAAVQDAGDFYLIAQVAVIDYMRACGLLEIAALQLDFPALFAAICQRMAGIQNIIGIAVCLLEVPIPCRIEPYILDIGFRGERESDRLHFC
jgi:hypothetical protein